MRVVPETVVGRIEFCEGHADAWAAHSVAMGSDPAAVAALMADTASIIKQVRAQADVGGDGVYALASLPAPKSPSPRPAPGRPTGFSISLDASGALTLRWKCATPPGAQGTIYEVWRRVGATGDFAYLGATGAKRFTDATLPAGSTAVTYQVRAVRSTTAGPWAQFNVNFGGVTTASVVEGGPAKVAA